LNALLLISFIRNIQFFGLEHQRKVTSSYVVIIGLGGVGSHAASMLLRSGVGRLLLVDFDQVSVSSLNRHAVATREDVGTPKALCLKKHFSTIFPESHVDAKVLLYDSSSEEEILSGNPDFVLDCIDNIDTKVALLAACVRKGLKVLSATGAGARADPTRIRVADLRESINDPLSRAVRHRLKKDYGIEGGIPVVFSLEKPKAKLLPFKGPTGEEENPSDYQIVPGFRVRIIPVLGTIPAIFGQVMASYTATQLAGVQVHMEPVVNFDMDHYQVLHQRLIEHEELLYGTAMQVQVDVEEVMYIAKELWHGRSARDQAPKDVGRGMWRSVNELMLVRWDCVKPASVSNLILLRFKEIINFTPTRKTISAITKIGLTIHKKVRLRNLFSSPNLGDLFPSFLTFPMMEDPINSYMISELSNIEVEINSTMGSTGVENTSFQLTVEKLNGKNFREWTQSIKLVIEGKGKLGYLTGETKKPTNAILLQKWKLENS
ncbi:tRNA threonylcarbamoyladenosine dehydratase 2, partial [Olea europaea var. sylvestris]|uniref:tRNA threonylcarbamoyladenosine dehydratase 2 n=1 Tax=Olea europaea var. sylvestris TaxID=158386 RepID=UPI000C1D2768